MYVLKKDLSKESFNPYRLCADEGDMPKSSANLIVELANGESKPFQLHDYLSLPPPRTSQIDKAKKMLQEQHGIDPAEVKSIDFFGGKYAKFK